MICKTDHPMKVSQSFTKFLCKKCSVDYCMQNLFYSKNNENCSLESDFYGNILLYLINLGRKELCNMLLLTFPIMLLL